MPELKYTMNKVFLDSNILIYLYSSDEIKKIDQIQDLLEKYQNIVISTQVLFEFSYVMHRKFKYNYSDIEQALKELNLAFEIVKVAYDTILLATKIASKYKYSLPDSLIVATALESGCSILFTEDMHNEQRVESSLNLVNPFVFKIN